MKQYPEYLYPFEKLRVWQESRLMVKEIYKLTSAYPKNEVFGLSSQLRRAIVSVSSNIAEGTSRMSKKDQARFSVYAYSSLMEVINQLILSVDLGYISSAKYKELKPKLGLLSNQLNKLKNTQLGVVQKTHSTNPRFNKKSNK